ncbi:MAG: GMC family oxidoreductase N-terminal domain-containing protein [Myxococcota bacterium]
MTETREPHTLIVGAGASGAVIAARLTERSDLDVLLVEAGPDYLPEALPPDLANGRYNSMSRHDWGFQHRPTPRMPRIPLPRGRVVGGSSAVNTCIALRGEPLDFDEWGLDGWSWEECLPAFKRLERDLDFPESEWHGSDGPLPVRRHPRHELSQWQAAFLDAGAHLGLPAMPDTNVPGATGVGIHAMNKIDGRRISAAEAWLTPEVRARPNLRIQADTLVRELVFHRDRVVGVDVERNGVVERIHAKRVLLCAGAVSTPMVLMRSGLGPAADLRRIGVRVVRDLPDVGRLIDHPGSGMFFVPRRSLEHSMEGGIIQTVILTKLGDGPYTNDIQLQAGSFIPTKVHNFPGVMLMVSLQKPDSVGRLTLRSADPHEGPVVDSALYTHPKDMELASRGLDLLRELAATPAMRPLARCFYPTRVVARSRRLRKRYLSVAADSGYHPSCTVAMGRVTDARGRIEGIEGLRICDASLFPTVPSSNIHVPTLMVGERFGEWLREDLD